MHMWSGADIEIDASASASASVPRCSWAPLMRAFCYVLCMVAFWAALACFSVPNTDFGRDRCVLLVTRLCASV